MIFYFKKLLSIPAFYHYVRQILLLGMPLKKWAEYGNYFKPNERIADLGCGPSDILRYIDVRSKPGFYLGIDISNRYLKQAEWKAKKAGLDSKFINLDLSQLVHNKDIENQLIEVLKSHKISTVNAFGVLHHIDDQAIIATLNAVHAADCVQSLNTQDVLIIEKNWINNFYVTLDRGEYVRKEAQYDALIAQTKWTNSEKKWSQAGIKNVQYIHYRLHK